MKIKVADVVRTGLLAGLAVALQAMNLPQPVTGPGVNAVLFVASIFVGPFGGVFVGVLTPWVALMNRHHEASARRTGDHGGQRHSGACIWLPQHSTTGTWPWVLPAC